MSTAYLAKMRFPWPHSPQFTSITNETKFYSGLRHLGIFHGCRKSLVHEMLKKKEKCGICSCIFMRICKHFLATRSAKIPWLNYFGIARPQLFAQLKKFAAPRMYTSSLNIYIYLSRNGVIIHNLNRNCALKLSLEGMRKLSYCSRHCL